MRYRASCDIMSLFKAERRIIMPVSYDKLWKILIDRKMNRTELKDLAGISFNILAKLGRDEFISMESLHKICVALNCRVDDVMEFTDYEHD